MTSPVAARRITRVCLLAAGFLLLILSASIAPAQSPSADHFRRGVERYRQGDWPGAIADFSRVIEQQSGVNLSAGKPDLITLRLGQLEVTVSALSVAYYNRALARHQLGEHDAALADFDQTLKLAPGNPEAWLNRGVLKQQMGALGEAWQDYAAAIKVYPPFAEAWYNRGYISFLRTDYRQALGDFNHALALQPRLVEALVNRSVARMQLGDTAGALRDCAQAIRLQPRDAKAWNNRGVIYNDLGKAALALSDFNRALQLDPLNVEARFNRGLVLLQMGRDVEAEQDLAWPQTTGDEQLVAAGMQRARRQLAQRKLR